MQRLIGTLLSMMLLAMLVGCGQPPVDGGASPLASPDAIASPATNGEGTASTCTDPDIRGMITNVSVENDGVVILIEGEIEEDTSYDRASVTVNQQTQISRRQGGSVTLDDLQNGVQVEACFSGPVMESYPVQAEADGVVILE